jgi:hypothetical protein
MRRRQIQAASRALGTNRPLGTAHLMIFVPSVDRFGKHIQSERWTRATLQTLGELFRGATAFPKGLGVWRDDERGGKLVFDKTTIVFSYVNPEDMTPAALVRLRHFLHRMGREARQGEIGLVLDGHYIGITKYEEK